MESAVSMKKKLRGQVSELIGVFPTLFPDYKNGLYFDELLESIMCNMHCFGGAEDKNVRLEEVQLIEFCCLIDSALEANGYSGSFAKNTVFDALIYYAHKQSRNPRREWLESLQWDGVPRVRTYFQRVIGATVPGLSPEDAQRYIGDVTVAWAMGSIARQYGPAQADIVPLLIGDQRIGKGNSLRFLTGKQEWYTDTTSDVTDPKSFLESIRGSAIVELSEATALRSCESERTKSFISKREDTYRRPYERTVTTVYRRWVLIATSNLRTPFTDITGNMRYYPIYCEDNPSNLVKVFFDNPELAMHESEQFWAEAMHLYFHGGCTPNLSEEVKAMAAKVQDGASEDNEAVDYLNDYLDSHDEYSKAGSFISREDIYAILRASPLNGAQLYANRKSFIFLWYNSKGCDWVKARPQVTDAMGTSSRPRGFVRKNDATVPEY